MTSIKKKEKEVDYIDDFLKENSKFLKKLKMKRIAYSKIIYDDNFKINKFDIILKK